VCKNTHKIHKINFYHINEYESIRLECFSFYSKSCAILFHTNETISWNKVSFVVSIPLSLLEAEIKKKKYKLTYFGVKTPSFSKMTQEQKEAEEIGIRELDLNDLHPFSASDKEQGAKYIVIGRANSGKTRLTKRIVYSKKHFIPVGQVGSGSEDSNGFFRTFFPPIFIHNDDEMTTHLDKKIKDPLLYEQNPIVQWKKRQTLAINYLESRGLNPWSLQILDDWTADSKFLKRPIISAIYKESRHWRTLHIATFQYCMDMPPSIRGNVTGVFIMPGWDVASQEKLYKNYAEAGIDKSEFFQVLSDIGQDYTSIYINKKASSSKIDDFLQYYKADINQIPKDWKFGCQEFWDFNEARYTNVVDHFSE